MFTEFCRTNGCKHVYRCRSCLQSGYSKAKESRMDKAAVQSVDIKKRFFRLNTLGALIVAAVIVYIFLRKFDVAQTVTIIKHSDLFYIIIAVIVFYGFIPLRGYRWGEFLKESNIRLPVMELTRLYFLAWFANSILPARIGDIYRAYLLKKNRDVSFALSLGVLFSERVFDLASTALLFLLGGLFYLKQVTSPSLYHPIRTGLLVIAAIVIFFVIFSWQSKSLRHILPAGFRCYYESFTEGLFRSPSKTPLLLGQSLLIWLSEAGRLYFVAWALGFKISLLLAVFISQGALILMSLPLTPAGLGLVELFMLAVLVPTGYNKEVAAAIVIADRLISYWSIIVFGGTHYFLSPRCR